MLFVESKISGQGVDARTRLALIARLQEKGLTPLIRAARMNCYEQALLGVVRAGEMERAVADWTETEDDRPYICGDLFCFEDFVLFLIFGNGEDEAAGMRAGIVYGAELSDPLRELDAFCQSVGAALDAVRESAGPGGAAGVEWSLRESAVSRSLERFAAETPEKGSSAAGRRDELAEPRAIELLEDVKARRLLHRLREAHVDGRVTELLANARDDAQTLSLIDRMADVGLLRREILVSCRAKGRSLFRLPSPDALNVITASSAMCSECGAAIADEKIEDLVTPTATASLLLEDGSWLAKRIHSQLRGLGIPEKQIAAGPTSDDGEAHILVNVSDEPFLFVLRDGDVTTANARHALARQMELEAPHLVVVATGKVQEDARVRLREHARRRARGGSDVEIILIEGAEAADELGRAFERVSERALARELSALNASLGLSVGFIIATRFRLMQRTGALKDLAASGVDALAGSLREF
ncbi:MAG TPA: hypothetical protein VF723_04265 [Pyrinomonadaceae bacterium]|jgi:hypothetical protein